MADSTSNLGTKNKNPTPRGKSKFKSIFSNKILVVEKIIDWNLNTKANNISYGSELLSSFLWY